MNHLKVGLIGLGHMGGGMAASLLRGGFQPVLSDVRPGAADPFLAGGASWAGSPRELASRVDAVLTSLPGPKEVESVALGPDGLLEGLGAGKAWFDLSTSSPTLIRRLHAQFAERGIHVLDAPVSGGPEGAKNGKLALWVGGDEEVFRRHKPILDALGDQVVRVGPIGSGLIAKLVHNVACFPVMYSLMEALTLGVKAGVDPLALWGAVRQGALGRARTFDLLDEIVLSGDYEQVTFALRLAHKDVRLATDLAREHGVPMPLSEIAFADMTEGLNRGWGELDARAPTRLQSERAGVKIVVDREAVRAVRAQDA